VLTIFTTWPGDAASGERLRVLSRAVGSWSTLNPKCQIVLFGDGAGLAEVADAHGAEHVPDVARNSDGTVRLDDIFAQAARLARHDLLCYSNGDILLFGDLLAAVGRVREWRRRFLLAGECVDLDLDALPADVVSSPARLQGIARTAGRSRGRKAIDWFVFPRALFGPLPPLALGRARWDNWLLWHAGSIGAAVVDATPVVTAIHQRHDYSHVDGGLWGPAYSTAADRNLALGGGERHQYFLWDASHRLTTRRVRRNLESVLRLRNRLEDARGRVLWRLRALGHLAGRARLRRARVT
jgi:hypothetical protein